MPYPSDLCEEAPFDEPAYSSWDVAMHGPDPIPDWVVTDLNAIDTDLGILKTGKEADVHLISRALPGGADCLLAAKRYRTADHRMFHRDAAYQEGRSTRRTRDVRAMEGRTGYGKLLLAGHWTFAEFDALDRMWRAGAPVPYPVQCLDTELMLEFVGEPDGTAAPRLAQCRPDRGELADLFTQCVDAMRVLAREGYAHGDLSAYNLLVHRGRLIMIDMPQIVDVVANPQGPEFLRRDCENVCTWFGRRGLPGADVELLFGDLVAEALSRS
ncbi:MAG TPA: RIO1 family regulatory kinase/ATPase [Jatrophihabitantaceae bacterium]|jgi:RIO kinase 1|nr:RIO1 family regulatory kinase/ATPase [Jatrophihabitantaceae bacterium]